MAGPSWALLALVLYPLLQVPAVLLLARYCEVDAEDLPTPPMRAYWRGSVDSAPHEGVRCARCGARNDPGFDRCQECVARL